MGVGDIIRMSEMQKAIKKNKRHIMSEDLDRHDTSTAMIFE